MRSKGVKNGQRGKFSPQRLRDWLSLQRGAWLLNFTQSFSAKPLQVFSNYFAKNSEYNLTKPLMGLVDQALDKSGTVVLNPENGAV